ncbi:MAG: SMP-30/gluconolactonase/LRE family protein [Rhodospirillales bacterium]|nr:SMP-30/gluconolactonase/LRE family protein [Rhodospirillales bacterium]
MIQVSDVEFVGTGLHRPESVISTKAGHIYTSNWKGGVTRIDPDGSQTEILAENPGFELRPNGIALLEDGDFALAHLGQDVGGVYRLKRSGALEPILAQIDGEPMLPTVYPVPDNRGRLWAVVSTRKKPRFLDYRLESESGFVVCVDTNGARIAADGLGYANECMVSPDGEYLYVLETYGRRVCRFRIGKDAGLSDRETVCEFGAGDFPDGLAFDQEGGLWVVCVVSNRLYRFSADGRRTLILSETDDDYVAWVEAAFMDKKMGIEHLDAQPAKHFRNISSIRFGGPDLQTVYMGCINGDRITSFRSPVPGVPTPNWDVESALD